MRAYTTHCACMGACLQEHRGLCAGLRCCQQRLRTVRGGGAANRVAEQRPHRGCGVGAAAGRGRTDPPGGGRREGRLDGLPLFTPCMHGSHAPGGLALRHALRGRQSTLCKHVRPTACNRCVRVRVRVRVCVCVFMAAFSHCVRTRTHTRWRTRAWCTSLVCRAPCRVVVRIVAERACNSLIWLGVERVSTTWAGSAAEGKRRTARFTGGSRGTERC